MSPDGLAASQRPFVWMRSRISPLRSAGPQGFRSSSIGKLPYGDWPVEIRWAPIGPANPASITFESRTFSPILKPPRNTVAAASTQIGQTGREVGGGRSRIPIHSVRASR